MASPQFGIQVGPSSQIERTNMKLPVSKSLFGSRHPKGFNGVQVGDRKFFFHSITSYRQICKEFKMATSTCKPRSPFSNKANHFVSSEELTFKISPWLC